jgi:hypothetical protein
MIDFADAFLAALVVLAVKAAAQGAMLDSAFADWLLVLSAPHLLAHKADFEARAKLGCHGSAGRRNCESMVVLERNFCFYGMSRELKCVL